MLSVHVNRIPSGQEQCPLVNVRMSVTNKQNQTLSVYRTTDDAVGGVV